MNLNKPKNSSNIDFAIKFVEIFFHTKPLK